MAAARDIRDDAAFLPGYPEMYGVPCTRAEMIALFKQFSVQDWLCTLARLSCVLAGSHRGSSEYGQAFAHWFVPDCLRARLQKWEDEHKKHGHKVVLPTERHVGILIEMALAHAPDTAPRVMTFPGDEKAVFDAFLMLSTLESPTPVEVSTPDDLDQASATFAALMYRSVSRDPAWPATRGFHIFRILQEREPDSPAAKWADLFEKATGHDIDSYYAGGFQCLVVAWGQTPGQLAAGWQGLPSRPREAELKCQWDSFQDYYAFRRGDIGDIRRVIEACNDVADMNDVSLIPLLAYPLIDLPAGTYPLYLRGVGESLCDGIYHIVSDAAQEGRLGSDTSRQDVGALFGNLYEAYVLDLLEAVFPGRLLRNPRRTDNGHEAADAIVMCPNGVMVFQIKGRHVRRRERYLPKSYDGLTAELRQSGLEKGCLQVKDSIDACRKGLIGELSYVGDLCDQPIQPVIVTWEPIPNFTLAHRFLDPFLTLARADGRTRLPILVDSDDLVRLSGLPPSDTWWGVFGAYVSSPDQYGSSFHNFLCATDRLGAEATNAWLAPAKSAVCEYLGMA